MAAIHNTNLLRSVKRSAVWKFLIAGLSVVLITAFAGVVGAGPAGAATKPAASSSCAEVNLIGLAGSGELDKKKTAGTDNMGQVVTDLSDKLAKAYAGTGITYSSHGIKYRAISVFDAFINPITLAYDQKAYDQSRTEGQAKLQSYINKFALSCPGGKIVLAGYSQGAQAVLDAYALLGPLQTNVAGIALFGDPLFNPALSPMDQGNFSAQGHGILGVRTDPGSLQNKTRSFCLSGDPVCNSPTLIAYTYKLTAEYLALQNCAVAMASPDVLSGLCRHLQYRDGSTKAAADFIRSTVPPLDHIAVAPGRATIKPGGSQGYKVTGFDTQNNSLGDRTLTSLFSISPDGTCVIGSCTASIPGEHTVTAVSGGKSAKATLTVLPQQAVGDVVYSALDANGITNIWVRHASDGSTVQLTSNTGQAPDVSPDGSRIAYIAPDPHALAANESSNITWVMNSDGSNAAPLDAQSQVQYYDSFPRWSPDGTHISVGRNYAWDKFGYNNNNGYEDIFILAASGGTAQVVTSDHQSFGPASWSPDGGRLAYYSNPAGLTVVNKDGSNVHLVAMAENTTSYSPEWAPGGDRIYVDTDNAGIMYFSSADGFATPTSVPRAQLMPGPVFRDLSPRASADGNTILFVGLGRCADGTNTCSGFNLFTVSSGGGVPTMLTSTAGASSASFIKG